MLGNWAAQNLASLDHEQLKLFQQVIDLENPDLFQWLTGQAPVPAEVDNPLLRKLCGMHEAATVLTRDTWWGEAGRGPADLSATLANAPGLKMECHQA